jgi:D-serine deaminase-like pyridoxal phosphate-dependent protein
MTSIKKSLALGFIGVAGYAASFSANAQYVISGFNSPDVLPVARPCLFIRVGATTYYSIAKTATNYNEVRQLAYIAYVLKTPVYFYFTGATVCGHPEINGLTS